MRPDGNSIWFEVVYYLTLGVVCLVPVAALAELVAAAFSKGVRQYIARHPVAHFLWFACALLLVALLIPAPSTPRHKKEPGVSTPPPNQPVERMAADARRLQVRAYGPAATAHLLRPAAHNQALAVRSRLLLRP